ncbi:MAG: DUF1579 domain-containing protein [Phycisphaerales bacterium JB039]
MKEKPQREHEWLHKLVGEWTYQGEAPVAPGEPPAIFSGTERVRTLGGLWVLAEATGAGPDGSPSTMLFTLGYDPKREHYVGTFIASVMTFLWVYDRGDLDSAGRALTMQAEGPNFSGEDKMERYRDIIEFVSDDHRILRSEILGPDGQWQQIMKAEYRRTK